MDTGSHLLLGVTLGGLAMAVSDPVIGDPSSAVYGLFAAAIIGSNAPDFDSVIRIRGYESYLLHHRGFSHSLPMLVGWPVLLTPLIAYLFQAWDHMLLLFLWTMAGVVFHVFLDFFNAYGVQCFRPISRKWFHADTIPIFDPVMFGFHLAALLLWLLGVVEAQVVFPLVYVLTFLFIGYRILVHRLMLQAIRRHYGVGGYSFLFPGGCPTDGAMFTKPIRLISPVRSAATFLRKKPYSKRESRTMSFKRSWAVTEFAASLPLRIACTFHARSFRPVTR